MIRKKAVKSRGVWKITFILPEDEIPENIEAVEVSVAGDFNDWDPDANPMKQHKDGSFRSTIEMQPDSEVHFRYVVNGEHWCNDWHADGYQSGGFGADNSIVITGDPAS